MKGVDHIIVTKKEAQGLLGIQEPFPLFQLEREEGIAPVRKRMGYTQGELRRLLNALQKVLNQKNPGSR